MGSSTKKLDIFKVFKAIWTHGLENFGRYYSLYRGIVADNDDPDNLQRLKLVIPQISKTSVYEYWAFPRNVYYGKGHGSQILPKKTEIVWVEFEGGDPEIPIWSHGHPGEGDMPTGDDELKDKNCYWYVTPDGHKIKINDTKSTIHIEHKNGQYVELNKNSISLVSSKGISLGTLDESKYHAVLGEELRTLLNDMESWTSIFTKALATDVAASGPFPYLPKASRLGASPTLTLTQAKFKPQILKILSTLNTLDK